MENQQGITSFTVVHRDGEFFFRLQWDFGSHDSSFIRVRDVDTITAEQVGNHFPRDTQIYSAPLVLGALKMLNENPKKYQNCIHVVHTHYEDWDLPNFGQ